MNDAEYKYLSRNQTALNYEQVKPRSSLVHFCGDTGSGSLKCALSYLINKFIGKHSSHVITFDLQPKTVCSHYFAISYERHIRIFRDTSPLKLSLTEKFNKKMETSVIRKMCSLAVHQLCVIPFRMEESLIVNTKDAPVGYVLQKSAQVPWQFGNPTRKCPSYILSSFTICKGLFGKPAVGGLLCNSTRNLTSVAYNPQTKAITQHIEVYV